MLQAHSPLWHYLWVGTHVWQVALALLMWRAGLHKIYPVFFAYTLVEAAQEFTLYGLDVAPSVANETFWTAMWPALIIEGLLKFAIVGELFRHLLRPWPMIAALGKRLITWAGVLLVLAAGAIAGLTTSVNSQHLIAGAHLLQQSMYVVESGLVLFIVLFAAHFKLHWPRQMFGIILGLGILSCEHLAAWAIAASELLGHNGYRLDFANMATYHVCVLIWMYYLLTTAPEKPAPAVPTGGVGDAGDPNLALWNHELERFLQR